MRFQGWTTVKLNLNKVFAVINTMIRSSEETKLTLTHVPGRPALPLSALVVMVTVLRTGMFELEHREEGNPFTQISNRAIGLLQLRHWVDA